MGLLSNAGETVKNYAGATIGNMKGWLNRKKLADKNASALSRFTYIKPEASEKASDMTMNRDYKGARSYVKDQLTKVEAQTRDVPGSNEEVRKTLRRYSK